MSNGITRRTGTKTDNVVIVDCCVYYLCDCGKEIVFSTGWLLYNQVTCPGCNKLWEMTICIQGKKQQ